MGDGEHKGLPYLWCIDAQFFSQINLAESQINFRTLHLSFIKFADPKLYEVAMCEPHRKMNADCQRQSLICYPARSKEAIIKQLVQRTLNKPFYL